MRIRVLATLLALWSAPTGVAAAEAALGPDRTGTPRNLAVSGREGGGRIVLWASRDWTLRQPGIVRAVITLHGRLRDASRYNRIALDGLAKAGSAGRGTLLLTPRFAGPNEADPGVLRWTGTGWTDGAPAAAPAPLSSFDVLDAILSRLSDRALFPSLRLIVLVGHSAGAQLVQRYMVLMRRPPPPGIALRAVIANPSSYAYFTPGRPLPVAACAGYDRWKYGLRDLPPYAAGTDPADLERRYVQRDVTLLLGTRDTDPTLPALDKSCAAEAQGATHLARGENFFRILQARHPRLNQSLREVPGVGHEARAMLTSGYALAAIYGLPPFPEGASP